MIIDKPCFIHLREMDDKGNYKVFGGATIAWVVDGKTGDILIGHPAKCMLSDKFVKDTGRNIALDNLTFTKPEFRIERATLVEMARKQAEAALAFAFSPVSPDARKMISNFVGFMVNEDIENTMGSNWYEQIVRAHFDLQPGNKLKIASRIV